MAQGARRVDDKSLPRLIGRYLRAGVMVEGVLQLTDVGTPQGGPLSPILSRSEEFEFLGFAFVKSRATINVAAKSIRRFKQRIRELTGRSWGVSMERRLSELRSYLRGWMGYFGLASQLKLFDRLDQWLRRRIRMCYWKQWRRPKRRRAMLIRLGVPRRQAIRHARSRKSYWHMAKTIASGVGLTNAWLAEQGLLALAGKLVSANMLEGARMWPLRTATF
jgi:RNA-directed DNA polymerase